MLHGEKINAIHQVNRGRALRITFRRKQKWNEFGVELLIDPVQRFGHACIRKKASAGVKLQFGLWEAELMGSASMFANR